MMTRDPFKLVLQKRLCDELRKIHPYDANHPDPAYHINQGYFAGEDYCYDLRGAEGTDANKLFRGRATYGESDPDMMVSVLEDYQQGKNKLPTTGYSGIRHFEYRLLIQGFVPDDVENPTDPAQRLQADLEQKIGFLRKSVEKTQFLFDFSGNTGNVTGIWSDSGGVRPPDDLSSVAYCWIEVGMDVFQVTTSPYEQQNK